MCPVQRHSLMGSPAISCGISKNTSTVSPVRNTVSLEKNMPRCETLIDSPAASGFSDFHTLIRTGVFIPWRDVMRRSVRKEIFGDVMGCILGRLGPAWGLAMGITLANL